MDSNQFALEPDRADEAKKEGLPRPEPEDLFDRVFATPTAPLEEQKKMISDG